MLGRVKEIQQPILSKIRKEVAGRRAQNDYPVKFIAIDGHGGSGKSTLANLLAKEFKAEIIHTDDFAFPDHPGELHQRLISDVFNPIKIGAKTLSYKPTKWWPDHKPKPVKDQPVTPVMIIEGISSTNKKFEPFVIYRIWVETPRGVCLKRGMTRDQKQGTEAEIKKLWEKWLDEEDEYYREHGGKNRVDLVVDGTVNIYE
jgi:uridine kinase